MLQRVVVVFFSAQGAFPIFELNIHNQAVSNSPVAMQPMTNIP